MDTQVKKHRKRDRDDRWGGIQFWALMAGLPGITTFLALTFPGWDIPLRVLLILGSIAVFVGGLLINRSTQKELDEIDHHWPGVE